jgi:hypothetical protein
MDAVLESKQFTTSEICSINYCRLYLQAVTLSDITLADGLRLDPHFLRGTSGPMSSMTNHYKVNQARPNNAAWQIWQRANYLWTSKGTLLRQPLGRWLFLSNKQQQSWSTYYDPSSNELLTRQDSGHYCIHPRTPHGYSHAADGHTNTLPSTCRPASALKGPLGWSVRRTVPFWIIQTTPPTVTAGTFDSYTKALPEWERILLDQIKIHSDLYTLHHALTTGTSCTGVSDGSVIVDQGALPYARKGVVL